MAMNSVLGPEAIHSQHGHSFTQRYQTHGLASPVGLSFSQRTQHDNSTASPTNTIKVIHEKLCTCSLDSSWVSDLLSIIEKPSVAQLTHLQSRHQSFRSYLRPPKGHVCNLQWQQHRTSDCSAKPATSQSNPHFQYVIMPRKAKRKIPSTALPGQNPSNKRQKCKIKTLHKVDSVRAELSTKKSNSSNLHRATDSSRSKVEASHALDEPNSTQEQIDDLNKTSNVRRSNRTRKATIKAIEIEVCRSNASTELKTLAPASTPTENQNSVVQSKRDSKPFFQDQSSVAHKRKAASPTEENDNNSILSVESGNPFKRRKLIDSGAVDTLIINRRSLRSSAVTNLADITKPPLSNQKEMEGSDPTTRTSYRNGRAKPLAPKRSTGRKERLVPRTAAAHSMDNDAPSISTDAYTSDQGIRRGGRGGGRGGRGGHNGRGRGGRGRGGGAAAGRGRGDSPERPVKHILTADERIEVTRLKKRQAELRSFFHLVGNQQAEILDVLAGRDLANITRKAKAHEKYPEFEEIVDELSHLRNDKTALYQEEHKLKCELALKEFKDAKELIELRFKKHVEVSKQEHTKGAAGDLAIFKKAIAFGDDDAHTVAGSEADYFPRYHELPEADAQVRGYCSSQIQDEKPFRRDLPSVDEVAARDVMEDEVTRPVVKALHRKREEELARSMHDEQISIEEHNPENTQAFDALIGVASSEQSRKDIQDINDRANVKPTHPPFPFDTFGLSKLADVADQAPRAQTQQQYHVLPPPQSMDSFTHHPSNYDNGFTKNLHFPPPPPRLYIPQQPPMATYPLPDSNIRSAGPLPSIPNHNRPPLLPPPLATKNLPPTSHQQQHSPHHQSAPLIASTPASRRSLRSIAPQPPQPPPASATTTMPPPAMQQQTYTFVPPQQPPQSTYYTTPPVRSPASSGGPGRTTSSPASMLATSGGPGPLIYHHISNGTTHGRNHNNQSHGPVSRSNSGSGPSTNQSSAPPNSNTTSKQGGQAGKITMQFFNSTIDGNGKRAILPKP